MSYTHKVSLLMKYESGLFSKDYSHGTFFDGVCYAESYEEACDIVNKFLERGEVELYEATERYISDRVADAKTSLRFADEDCKLNFWGKCYERSKHVFGDGYVSYDAKPASSFYTHRPKNYHWLKIESMTS